ncbi:MAG: hypothetical protein M1830_003643 [Pleopsidium flavum]|nr:MAG: hypothetical protein M1830_003643 [Pleopsidium flavum]
METAADCLSAYHMPLNDFYELERQRESYQRAEQGRNPHWAEDLGTNLEDDGQYEPEELGTVFEIISSGSELGLSGMIEPVTPKPSNLYWPGSSRLSPNHVDHRAAPVRVPAKRTQGQSRTSGLHGPGAPYDSGPQWSLLHSPSPSALDYPIPPPGSLSRKRPRSLTVPSLPPLSLQPLSTDVVVPQTNSSGQSLYSQPTVTRSTSPARSINTFTEPGSTPVACNKIKSPTRKPSIQNLSLFGPGPKPHLRPPEAHSLSLEANGWTSIVYLSELIPSHFNNSKHNQILHLLNSSAHVPYCVVMSPKGKTKAFYRGRKARKGNDLGEDSCSRGNPATTAGVKLRLPYLGRDGQGWPKDKIPVEIFEHITQYLPRDSVQNMRLVSREFEVSVSHLLFKTVVVPFRPELYGMVEASRPIKAKPDVKGKGKARVDPQDDALAVLDDAPLDLYWSKSKAGSVDDGMKVFQGWGPHITKFGMSFELDEGLLSNPPDKGSQDIHQSFWGEYEWPYQYYHRFKYCAGLEQTADESQSMTAAFSNLSKVTELAISIDSGLGWLCGPDISDRAQIFKGKPSVFGRSNKLPDLQARERKEIWKAIIGHYRKSLRVTAHYRQGGASHPTVRNGPLRRFTGIRNFLSTSNNPQSTNNQPATATTAVASMQATNMLSNLTGQPATTAIANMTQHDPQHAATLMSFYLPHPLQQYYASIANSASDEEELVVEELDGDGYEEETADDEDFSGLPSTIHGDDEEGPVPPLIMRGVDINTAASSHESSAVQPNPFEKSALIPNHLTSAQKEFLLETDWAIQAFLASYTLAIMDNNIFRTVCTLNIATLSSRHIYSLRRHDLWAALPNVHTLELHIIPDWRDIVKEHASFVATPVINPSVAAVTFNTLLQEFIAPLKSIKTLSLGWLGGGERATGIFARNQHLLPAPLTMEPSDMLESLGSKNLVHFPHAKQITLTNCWLSPNILVAFVQKHEATLRVLKLDSVSLTAMPEFQAQPLLAQAGNALGFASTVQTTSTAVNHGPTDWLSRLHRQGSWPDVIENITPGTTLADLRDARDAAAEPAIRCSKGSLKRIDFQSCGYAILPNAVGLDQTAIDLPYDTSAMSLPLQKRQLNLTPFMMQTQDQMLGRIIPRMKKEELNTLLQAWNMHQGWGRNTKKYHSLEDGQPLGGSGRFSGSV